MNRVGQRHGNSGTENEPVVDAGLAALSGLYQMLDIDDEWSVRRPRGFTWWPYRLPQNVEVGLAEDIGGQDVYTIRIWTDIVVDVVPDPKIFEFIGAVNVHQTMNALVWDQPSATIKECCTVTVNRESVPWAVSMAAYPAILQSESAHARAHGLAEICGGRLAARPHPHSGVRPQRDGVLDVPRMAVNDPGAGPSNFAGDLVARLPSFAREYGWFGNGDGSGFTCEVPFVSHMPAIDSNPARGGLETALVQVFTDQPHPQLGNGALIVLQLPISPGSGQALVIANALNAQESEDAAPVNLLGAWCPDLMSANNDGLAFTSFVPDKMSRPGMLETMVLNAAHRAQLAAHLLSL